MFFQRLLRSTSYFTVLCFNYVGLHVKQQKLELAEFLYTDCLRKRTAVLGAQHPCTLLSLSSLAALFTHMVSCFLI